MADHETTQNITSTLKETRVFEPSHAFRDGAHVSGIGAYEALYRRSMEDTEGFWAEVARELHWFSPWERVLEWDPPFAKWFVGATTNISYNCLDRHLTTWRRNKAALIWEGEPGE